MEKVSLKKQSLYLSMGKILGFGIQFFTPVILVRILSRYDYGLYQQFLLAFSLIVQMFGLGLNSSLYYFFPNSDDKTKASYLSQTYLMMAVISVILLIAILFFNESLFDLLNVESLGEYSIFFASYVFFMMMSSIKDNIFILEFKEKYNLVFYPLEKILRLSLVIILAFLTPEVYSCIIALNIYSFILFTFILYYLGKNYFLKHGFLLNMNFIRGQLIYAIPFAGGIMLNTLTQRIDKVMVNAYVTPDQYAIYSISFFSIPILQQVFASIKDVSLTRLSAHAKSGEFVEATVLWHKVIYKSCSIIIPTIIFVVCIAREMIQIMFTEKYLEATLYFQLYTISFIFQTIAAGIILRGFNKTQLVFVSNLVGLGVTFMVGTAIIGELGLLGAILTAFTAAAVPKLTQFFFAVRSLELSIPKMLPWKELGLILLLNIPPMLVVLLLKYFSPYNLLTLLAGAMIYFPIVVFLQYRKGIFIYPELLEKGLAYLKRIVK